MVDPLPYCRRFIAVPFVLGRSDCATFAAGWAEHGLGAQRAPVRRLGLEQARVVGRDIARMGKMAARWARRAGLAVVPRPACRGDIGLVEIGDGAGFGICLGHDQWVMRASVGIAFVVAPPVLVIAR